MKTLRNPLKFPLLAAMLLAAVSLAPARAHAFSIDGYVGKYFAENEGLLWTGELMLGTPLIDLGAFYEHSGESPSTHGPGDESRSFYGVVGRFTLPIIPIFLDLRLGPHNIGFGDGSSWDGFTSQLGVGYVLALTTGLNLLPRVGMQLGDSNSTYPEWNASIGLGLTIL